MTTNLAIKHFFLHTFEITLLVFINSKYRSFLNLKFRLLSGSFITLMLSLKRNMLEKMVLLMKSVPLAVFNSCFNKKCINTGKKATLMKPFHGIYLS